MLINNLALDKHFVWNQISKKIPKYLFWFWFVNTFAASHRGASAVAEAEIIPIEPDTDNAGAGKVNSSNY